MEAINAIYDGNIFKPLEPIPVKGKYEVVITFTKALDETEESDAEIEAKIQRMLKFCGTWSDEDVELMEEIVRERENFSKGREEYDFS